MENEFAFGADYRITAPCPRGSLRVLLTIAVAELRQPLLKTNVTTREIVFGGQCTFD